MADRTVRVRLEAVTSAYREEMQKSTQATEGLLGKVKGLDSAKLQSFGKDMSTKVTLPIAAAMGVAAKSASDLQQAVGGTEAVFGDLSKEIDRHAQTAARAAGLSEREFREATTSIGGQLKRMTGDVDLAAEQSIQLTQVAADLAATYGGTTAEAVAALGSAFRGEADPAERFNLNLKIGAQNAKAVEMGLARSEAAVDDNARAQATLALIMEQSADAQGQFARESDSAAGSMQIAKAEMENASAEIGSALLPALSSVATSVAGLARGFADLPEPVKNGILALAGIAAVSGPVMTFTGKVMDMNSRLRDSEGGLTKAGKAAKGFGMVLGGLGIAAIALEFHQWADSLSDLNREASDLEGKGLSDLEDALTEILQSGIGKSAGVAERSFDLVTDAITRMARESPAVVEQLVAIAETADGRLARAMDQAGVSAADLQAALDAGIGSQVRSQETQERSAEILEEATGATEQYGDEVLSAADQADALEKAIKGVTQALRNQFDPFSAAVNAMTAHEEAQRKVEEAHWAVTKASDDLAAAIKAEGKESWAAKDAARNLEDAKRRLDAANRDVVDSTIDMKSSMMELRTRMQEGNLTLSEAAARLDEWVRQGLITEAQAKQVRDEMFLAALAADELGKRSPTVSVRANLDSFYASMREAAAVVDAFNQSHGTAIPVYRGPGVELERRTGGPIPGAVGQPVPILAHGGEYVLSADVVNAIKNGRPSAGLPGLASVGAGSGTSIDQSRRIGEQHIHFHGKDAPNPLAALAWAVA